VTTLVHGDAATRAAEEVSGLLFGGGEAKSLSRDALLALQLEIPVFTVEPKDELTTQDIVESTLVGTDALFGSKGDMRRMLQQGGVYVNGRRMSPEREPLAAEDLLGGEFVLVRKGAKNYGLVKAR
jgi:tyrosyl-tRNA synthetase